MGRNKDLRKKIAGRQRMIEGHEEKIRVNSPNLIPTSL